MGSRELNVTKNRDITKIGRLGITGLESAQLRGPALWSTSRFRGLFREKSKSSLIG